MNNDLNINRGYLYIMSGLIILLYVLGFISKILNNVLALVAVGLIGYGLYKIGAYHIIKNRFFKK